MTQAILSIRCSGAEARRSLESVLSPDNEGGPRELRISVTTNDDDIKFRISSATPLTAISTALGILRDVSLFEEVWLLSREGDGGAHRN